LVYLEILLMFSVFAGVLIIWARRKEQSYVFFPHKELACDHHSSGLPCDDVFFRAEDGTRLNGWFFKNPVAKYTIIFYHGYKGNVSHHIGKVAVLYFLGFNVLEFDYRGYGKSAGRPSEKGFYQDAEAAYDYVVRDRKTAPLDVILFGESFGGTLAIHTASCREVKALITEGAFTSITDMAKLFYSHLPLWLMSLRFDGLSKIKDVKAPKLVMHSVNDKRVPYFMSKKLFDEAAPPKTHVELNGSHLDAYIVSERKFRENIIKFLHEISGRNII